MVCGGGGRGHRECGWLLTANPGHGHWGGRQNAPGVGSRVCISAGPDAGREKPTQPGLGRLLQSGAAARGFRPASAGRALSAQRSPDASAAQSGQLWARLESAAGAQSRSHQVERTATFYWKSFCGRIGGTQNNERGDTRSLPPTAFARNALRSRSDRNATSLYRASSMNLGACPPPRNRSLGGQLRSGSLRSPALRRPPNERANCYPCH